MAIVDTTGGKVEGREHRGVLRFAGLPYAAPPVGELRFRPPEPHPGWSGVRDAGGFGPVSVQTAGALEQLAGSAQAPDWSEDCLFLNVWTPAADDARRPVMFWIHGGGFSTGSGSVPWYDGARFAANGDLVVVTINYRLAALGWLHLEHLDPGEAGSSNAGLLDQIAALEWVRDNIAAFGGDPGNVTIFGESAGGMSVATLMGTPTAAGLFHKAIPQSGAAHNVVGPEAAAEVTDRLLAELGVRDVAELRAVEADRLLAAQQDVSTGVARDRAQKRANGGLGLPFSPVVDGRVLPRQPLEAVREGSAASVPLLVGTTAEEWKLFALMLSGVEDEETLLRRLGRMVEDPHTLAAAYRQANAEASHDEVWTALLTDRIFRIPAIRLAEAQLQHRPDATYSYLFEWASTAFGGRLGSCHALEIPFVFDALEAPGVRLFTGDEPPQRLAEEMHRAWIAFARTGNPNHDGLADWPTYDLEDRATMHFGVPSQVVHDHGAETRLAWDGLL